MDWLSFTLLRNYLFAVHRGAVGVRKGRDGLIKIAAGFFVITEEL